MALWDMGKVATQIIAFLEGPADFHLKSFKWNFV